MYRAFREEMEKLAGQGRISSSLLRRMGKDELADKNLVARRRVASNIYHALNYKIPGTGNTRLPGMTDSRRRRLTKAIADNPDAYAVDQSVGLATGVPTAVGDTAIILGKRKLERRLGADDERKRSRQLRAPVKSMLDEHRRAGS